VNTYLGTYFLALLIAVVLTPAVIAWARKKNLVDTPDVRKIHTSPTARVGGISIFIATLLAVIAPFLLGNPIGQILRQELLPILALLVASSMVFAVGLFDDIRHARIRTKLGIQLVATLLICSAGICLNHITIQGVGVLDLRGYGLIITVLWIIGVTNAINLIDGMDGLAGGISAIASGAIAAMAVQQGNIILAVIMLALFGSLTGFLFFNFHPAKIFMGDSGSLFLGFIIASSSIMTAEKSEGLIGIGLPLLVLGIPIFDTLQSILRRFLRRRGIMSPDRGHFHHRLIDMGFKQHHVAILAYTITAAAAGFSLAIMNSHGIHSVVMLLGSMIAFVLFFRSIGCFKFYEMLTDFQKRVKISHRDRIQRKDFENAQLELQKARSLEQWWECMCKAADVMEFTKLCLAMDQTHTQEKRLEWTKDVKEMTLADMLQVKIPIYGGERSNHASLEIDVQRKQSLESAGRRIALFTRLTEESRLESILNPDTSPPASESPIQLRFPFKDSYKIPFTIAPE